MGCFLACFGSSKDQKRQQQRNKVLPPGRTCGIQKPLEHTLSSEQDISVKCGNSRLDLHDGPEKQLSSSARKKVTFSSNVKTLEPVSLHETTDIFGESGKGSNREEEKNCSKSSQSRPLSENNSVTSSIGTCPLNHRYQDCRDSDDEFEELDEEDRDLDDKKQEEYNDSEVYSDYRSGCKEGWSESGSAPLVIDEVMSPVITFGLPQKVTKAISSNLNARDRSVYVHSVLSPVENLTQWKVVKLKETPLLEPEKENCIADREAPCISFVSEPNIKDSSFCCKSNSENLKNLNKEIAVDASLSNWLTSCETTPTKMTCSIGFEVVTSDKIISQGSNPVMNIDDKPILGALTVGNLGQLSAYSPPRKAPSQSTDKMPKIAAVGTYWNHVGPVEDFGSTSSYRGIPNTTSKYREDKRVNWHSTPFEKRLERALDRGAAES